MLWALLISLILRQQFGCQKGISKLPKDLEHTPGFYQLDAHRSSEYLNAMAHKVNSALAKYNQAEVNMAKAAKHSSQSPARTSAFFKLCAADNNVIKSRQKLTVANEDAVAALTQSNDVNATIETLYKLAYRSRIDLFKHELLHSRVK